MIYAVIDTNVLVSALITHNSLSATAKVVRLLLDGEFIPLYESSIIEEYQEVLHREKFKLVPGVADALISFIKEHGIETSRTAFQESMPDEDDRVFYEVSLSVEDSFKTGRNSEYSSQPASSTESLSAFMDSVKTTGAKTFSSQPVSSPDSLSGFMNSVKTNDAKPAEHIDQSKNATNKKSSSKKGKKILWILAALLVVFLLSRIIWGDRLSGTTWKYTSDVGSYTMFSFSNGTLTFTETDLITGKHETKTLKYTIHGNQIDLEPGGKNINWEIKGNQLILDLGGELFVLTRN